jgi:hypothetical protein
MFHWTKTPVVHFSLFISRIAMKKIYDPYVNKVVEILAAPQLLELDGIAIAGGFATALYHMYLLPEGTRKTICKYLNTEIQGFVDVKNLTDRIGDIDYWVLKGSEAEEFLHPWIERDEEDKVKYIDRSDETIRKAFKDRDLLFEKASRFSLSFSRNTSVNRLPNHIRFKEQIIRLNTYQTVEDIFKDFDLSLCRVGWYKGYLYVSGDAEADFVLGTINTNKPLNDYDNSFQRVWSTQRLFKYYKRYGFQPTKKTVQETQEVFVEAIEFLNGDKEEQNKQKVHKTFGPGFVFHPVQAVPQPKPTFGQVNWTPAQKKVEDPYDSWRNRTVEQMRRYYTELLYNINILFSFEEYNMAQATLLLDVEEPTAKKKLRDYLESGGKKYQPETEVREETDGFLFEF